MIAVIVQARTGSNRLPGKVTMPWGKSTLLRHVLLKSSSAGAPLWLAISTDTADDVLAGEWHNVHRGPLDDVLGRFVGCVEKIPEQPDAIMRVCADRPFINPTILKAMIRYWNAHPGLDMLEPSDVSCAAEIVSVWALRSAHLGTKDPYHREHVTTFIRDNPKRFKREVFPLTVDTLADYEALAP